MLALSLSAGLEKALNLYLESDPEIASGLDRIADRQVLFELLGLDLKMTLIPKAGGRIAVYTNVSDPPDAIIRATPLALVRTAFSTRPVTDGENLIIEGDVEVAEHLWSVLRGIDLDWEEWLSGVMGDTFAHVLSERLQGLMTWGKRCRDHLADDIGEYVAEESRMTPASAELDDLLDAVDQLREGIDRLEIRLNRLESHTTDDHS